MGDPNVWFCSGPLLVIRQGLRISLIKIYTADLLGVVQNLENLENSNQKRYKLYFSLFLCFIGKLFHRVILMSGSALAPWAVVSDPARATLQVASTLNCTEEQLQAQKPNRGGGGGRGGRGGGNIGDQSLLGCLRSVPLYQLMRAARPAALHQAAMAKQDHR